MNVSQVAARAAAHKAAAVANLQDARKEAAARAGDLWAARKEHKRVAALRHEERQVTEGHPLDLFPTPAELARRMVAFCDDPFYKGGVWLEPSAGTGRIAQAIKDAGYAPNCIELNYNSAELLKKRGFSVRNLNFLEVPATGDPPREEPGRVILPECANVIIMNPPFSHGQDIKHVRHAFNCLAEGGRLVAIMSASAKSRAFCEDLGAYVEDLPAGTFKASGTMVPALLVVIDK